MVMHSTTKYLNGHSDVTGGILVTKEITPFWEKVKIVQGYGGAVPAPFDCYLVTRGIKTLPYRMRGHVANAQALAKFLENHEAVEAVFYPGLASHPQHELAKKQMPNGGGGVVCCICVHVINNVLSVGLAWLPANHYQLPPSLSWCLRSETDAWLLRPLTDASTPAATAE